MENETIPEDLPLRCDCCNRETLAVWRRGKLIIRDKRHGKLHLLTLTLGDIETLQVMETSRRGRTKHTI